MNHSFFRMIIENPEAVLLISVAFLLACCGFAVVIRSSGAHEFFPQLLRFLLLLFEKLGNEFRKKSSQRSAIETIDFWLVIGVLILTVVFSFLLLLPCTLAQVIGVCSDIKPICIDAFVACVITLPISGLLSGVMVIVDNRDSSIRSRVVRLLEQVPPRLDSEDEHPQG